MQQPAMQQYINSQGWDAFCFKGGSLRECVLKCTRTRERSHIPYPTNGKPESHLLNFGSDRLVSGNTYSLGFQPPNNGVNITTIAYIRVLIIEIGSTIILMVVEAQGTVTKSISTLDVSSFFHDKIAEKIHSTKIGRSLAMDILSGPSIMPGPPRKQIPLRSGDVKRRQLRNI